MSTLPECAQPFRGRECSPEHKRAGTCSTCHWFDSHEVTGISAGGGECFHPTSPPVGFRGRSQPPWGFLGRHQSCVLWQERTEPGVSVEEAKRGWEECFGRPYPEQEATV